MLLVREPFPLIPSPTPNPQPPTPPSPARALYRLPSSQAANLFGEFQSLMSQINGTRVKILRLPPRKNNAGDVKLQQSIHKATAEILQQLHFSLPKLPTEADVDDMQVRRPDQRGVGARGQGGEVFDWRGIFGPSTSCACTDVTWGESSDVPLCSCFWNVCGLLLAPHRCHRWHDQAVRTAAFLSERVRQAQSFNKRDVFYCCTTTSNLFWAISDACVGSSMLCRTSAVCCPPRCGHAHWMLIGACTLM